LARRILFERAGLSLDDPAFPGAHHSLADELLKPSVVYAPAIAALTRAVDVRGIAHITGGGIPGNLNRVLPAKVDAVVERGSWESPRIFGELQRLGEVSDAEMAKVFNLGIGMIVVVPEAEVYKALDVLRSHDQRATVVGSVTTGHGAVQLV
jgi:phosphoribosylformylglycinamidine cyclo-ligase